MKIGYHLIICLILGMIQMVGYADDELLAPVEIHGFLSQGYLNSTENNYLGNTKQGTFAFNEFGINLNTRIDNDLQIGIQILARDFGDQGKDKPGIDWASINYRHYDWLGVEAGIIKTPIGLYNDSRDLDFTRTFVLLPEAVYPEEFRDFLQSFTGVGLYGNVPLHRGGSVDYHTFLGTTEVGDDSGLALATESNAPPGVAITVNDVEFKKLYGGQVFWNTPLTGLKIGGTYAYFDYDEDFTVNVAVPTGLPAPAPSTTTLSNPSSTNNRIWMRIASGEYTWRDLVVASEYFDADQATTTTGSGLPENVYSLHGIYLSATYRLAKHVEVGSYYSVLRFNHEDQQNPNNYLKDTAACVRCDINRYWLVKLEGHYYEGNFTLLNLQNLNSEGVPDYAKVWWMLAAKTTVSF